MDGNGPLEGIAASESANNAVIGSALIPLFTLGIPGNMASALLIGAFVMHGVTPGPLMFEQHGDLVYGVYTSMIIGCFDYYWNAGNTFIRQTALRSQKYSYAHYSVYLPYGGIYV